jgi:tetratricopeptide (TPR) repeat protein
LDDTARIWDARTGRNSWHEEHPNQETFDAEEFERRLIQTRPNYWRYHEGYDAASKANNRFSVLFYFDRLLSLPLQRTTQRFRERNEFQADPRLIARTSFHHSPLAKTSYDLGIVQAMAVAGDRLSQRLLAQQFIRDGQPGKAIPLLYSSLVFRPLSDPPKPPVEELLIAKAYMAMNNLPEAKRYFKAAADWLDRPRNPTRAANIVTHAINPWNAIGEAFKPIDDPRHNPFDWESWHECDVFRAEVERLLAVK